jgi:hypothetical protein
VILTDQQKKLLSRIACDAPGRGDGQEFLKLLSALEVDSLRNSRTADETLSRWKQGESFGYEALIKHFKDANK